MQKHFKKWTFLFKPESLYLGQGGSSPSPPFFQLDRNTRGRKRRGEGRELQSVRHKLYNEVTVWWASLLKSVCVCVCVSHFCFLCGISDKQQLIVCGLSGLKRADFKFGSQVRHYTGFGKKNNVDGKVTKIFLQVYVRCTEVVRDQTWRVWLYVCGQ